MLEQSQAQLKMTLTISSHSPNSRAIALLESNEILLVRLLFFAFDEQIRSNNSPDTRVLMLPPSGIAKRMKNYMTYETTQRRRHGQVWSHYWISYSIITIRHWMSYNNEFGTLAPR